MPILVGDFGHLWPKPRVRAQKPSQFRRKKTSQSLSVPDPMGMAGAEAGRGEADPGRLGSSPHNCCVDRGGFLVRRQTKTRQIESEGKAKLLARRKAPGRKASTPPKQAKSASLGTFWAKFCQMQKKNLVQSAGSKIFTFWARVPSRGWSRSPFAGGGPDPPWSRGGTPKSRAPCLYRTPNLSLLVLHTEPNPPQGALHHPPRRVIRIEDSLTRFSLQQDLPCSSEGEGAIVCSHQQGRPGR